MMNIGKSPGQLDDKQCDESIGLLNHLEGVLDQTKLAAYCSHFAPQLQTAKVCAQKPRAPRLALSTPLESWGHESENQNGRTLA